MRFPAWKNRSADWVGRNKKGLVIALGLTAVGIFMSPWLSPGGIGLRGSSSVVEKTVKQLSDGEIEETTTTTITSNSGKTFLDWLSLLGVPLSLVLLGAWIQRTQQQQSAEAARRQSIEATEAAERQRKQAEAVAKAQREQAISETQEEVLQIYFDRISVLLVDKNLLGIAEKEDIPNRQKELLSAAVDVIRARTLSILRRFRDSGERKASVIRFLIETEIIAKLRLSLSGADLSGADLFFTNLSGANLSGADLRDADLVLANLSGANLSGANLSGANLSTANLRGASLRGAGLDNADMSTAIGLTKEQLKTAILCKTRLPETLGLTPDRDCSSPD